jgi:hypothetical protein
MLLRYKIEGYILITTLIAKPTAPNRTNINITEY